MILKCSRCYLIFAWHKKKKCPRCKLIDEVWEVRPNIEIKKEGLKK